MWKFAVKKRMGVDSIRAILGAKRVKKTDTESTTRYTRANVGRIQQHWLSAEKINSIH